MNISKSSIILFIATNRDSTIDGISINKAGAIKMVSSDDGKINNSDTINANSIKSVKISKLAKSKDLM